MAIVSAGRLSTSVLRSGSGFDGMSVRAWDSNGAPGVYMTAGAAGSLVAVIGGSTGGPGVGPARKRCSGSDTSRWSETVDWQVFMPPCFWDPTFVDIISKILREVLAARTSAVMNAIGAAWLSEVSCWVLR